MFYHVKIACYQVLRENKPHFAILKKNLTFKKLRCWSKDVGVYKGDTRR